MEPSSITQRFFGSEKTNTNQSMLVSCGQSRNSLFKAIAVSLIDAITTAARIDDELMKSVLNAYFSYFPDLRDKRSLITIQERFQSLKNSLHVPELVETMAYVLRQIAIDEMLQHPEKYPMVFLGADALSSVESLRSDKTIPGEQAAHAISNALSLPVQLSLTETGKELPVSVSYNHQFYSARKPELHIGLVNQHAFAKVRQPEFFSALTSRKARDMSPEQPNDNQYSYEKDINQYVNSVWETYQHMLRSLDAAVSAGEITKDQLIERYISALSNTPEENLYPRGTQALFELIYQQKQEEPKLPDQNLRFSHEALVVEELSKALARMVSVGLLEEDELYQEQVQVLRQH